MKRLLTVALGGALGAMARYTVNLAVARFWIRDFPLATLLVNVSGSFILGLFAASALVHTELDPAWRLFIATGFVGAYTTFSTFEYETHRLTELGASGWALTNVLTSVVAGFVAVRIGLALGR
ncbi:MAG: fluoride efflux transporter CrcB [Thermoanaerobaculia bacterium]